MNKPLVSILICAYNAEKTVAQTLDSVVAQTWPNKEIIVLDDGSTDRTAEIVSQFKQVTLVSTDNQGFSAAQNRVFQLSHGDYIQYLDADDLLAPDKIEGQLATLRKGDSARILFSSPWAPFFYRTRNARFVRNSLCQDLSPVEWLLRKMSEGIHMQNATWLVSRELATAAGPWDTRLQYDQDGEFFCRVLLASEGTRFVDGTGIYYRSSGWNRISFIGNSEVKKDSLLRSMKAHMRYLQSLEKSDRVDRACLAYIKLWCLSFYPERPDIMAELRDLAHQLGGELGVPGLRAKYAWLQNFGGYGVAKQAQTFFPMVKTSLLRAWDKMLYRFEGHARANIGHG